MGGLLRDLNNKEKELMDQLSTCPIVEISGIVGANGVGAGRTGNEILWTMTMKFEAWRIDSKPLRAAMLTVRRKVSDEELGTLQRNIKADTVIKIRARVSEENLLGSPQALLEEVTQINFQDTELNNYLTKLKEPVTYQDEIFGTLTYDRQIQWYSAKVEWIDKNITLNLSAEKTDDLESVLRTAHDLYSDKIAWNKRIRDYAVHELLPLKNESWLEKDESEVTERQFIDKMSLESITVYPDGRFEFWNDDGDLFWGHSILISGDFEKGPTDADIPG